MDSDDFALLERWLDGDANAGSKLAVRHLPVLRRYFRRTCGPLADDLVQQTFLACLQSARSFRGESSFRAFLLGVARNQLFAQRRIQKRDCGVLSEDPSRLDDLAAPSTRSHRNDRAKVILVHAVTQLAPDLRVVLE
ncbi:MAG TPA: RNA polymerase sigma factor, partial [Polyangiaceae bacterium]|nr:RNA polymerase sigma factor [Polyangiaceae bacterium]